MAETRPWAPNPHAGLVTITKCDHRGEPQIRYPGEQIYADATMVSLRCVWSLQRTYTLGGFSINGGDILVECFFRTRWYNIFAVYGPGGKSKGWYCNVTYPTRYHQKSLAWHDLALDLLVMPNGEQHVLDRDEFSALDITDPVRRHASQALADLQAMARANTWPLRISP